MQPMPLAFFVQPFKNTKTKIREQSGFTIRCRTNYLCPSKRQRRTPQEPAGLIAPPVSHLETAFTLQSAVGGFSATSVIFSSALNKITTTLHTTTH